MPSELGVIVRGMDRVYRIDCSSVDALARIEDATSLLLADLITALQRTEPDIALMCRFLGAALVNPADASEDEVAAILADIGGPSVIVAAVSSLEQVSA